jgi:signal transduction histidine kinase/DNA-binding response OmpR family regulator/ABC-type xylose transport system substrate-binding protein
MKWSNFTFFGLVLFCLGVIITSCNQVKHTKKFTIGFSQCTGGDAWRKQMLVAMQGELAFHPNIELVFKDAAGDNAKQVKDIHDLINANIDLLIVSPNEADPITPIVEDAFKQGIPVIVIDRKINSSLYTAYIGANNYEIGILAGTYISEVINYKGKIMEIWGLRGSTPAIERSRGFKEVISKYPGITVVSEINGAWEIDTVKQRLSKPVNPVPHVDVVFAHNDVMAYGAYSILRKDECNRETKFVGIDGLPGPGGGIQLVDDAILKATFLYPTGGEDAIRIASKILHQEPFEKENILHSTVIDSKNVRVMKLQTDKIASQQKDIVRQQGLINEQLTSYYNQRRFIYVLSVGLIIVIAIGASSIISWRKMNEANQRLEAKTHETLEQKNKIAEMAHKAELASQEKLSFFTNISHEFRTPLTLIMGPIDELMNKCEDLKPYLKDDLKLIKKNALRLLLLVNQLMDFRKIEDRKMQLKTIESDIVEFIKEVMSSFEKTAKSRKIEFKLHSTYEDLNVWFDPDKLDKVIFNLLSNAFKFIHDKGKITITIARGETEGTVVIFIEDNGIGMSRQHIERAFDRFYTGENFGGTGLGLSLSKEFIEMHHGDLLLKSEKGVGTRFCIILPLGKEHLQAQEIAVQGTEFVRAQSQGIVIDDISLNLDSINFDDVIIKEHTILIIDDNSEMRAFIRNSLTNQYNVEDAYDGPSGLKRAFEIVPDLIICDVMLPGKSGLDISKLLKTDLRTSHIPIIILTAMGSMEQKINGIKIGADEYITKPFVFEYLNERIRALIKNRKILKDHYSHDLNIDVQTPYPNHLDKKFINDFTSTIEKHLSKSDLSVNEIAHELGMSRIQVYRKVKAVLGFSVNEYLVNVRLKKAKHMLLNSERSIAEIAFEVGFSSPAYFSTLFKSKFHISPKDFKTSMLS